MENRRNYYRILQVQADAAPALIKASYRTLMQKLKYHPDLGGDDWNAALVNEAYYILSNEKRRAEYDESLGDALFPRTETPEKNPQAVKEEVPVEQASGVTCLFCEHHNEDQTAQFCFECQSPLDPIQIATIDQEIRRAITRVTMHDDVQYYTTWPQNPHIGSLLDISPAGMGMQVSERLVSGEIIKIESMVLSAIGQVMHVAFDEKHNPVVGVKLLTASFHCDQGTFLNVAI